jgi:predicted dehydrogenase
VRFTSYIVKGFQRFLKKMRDECSLSEVSLRIGVVGMGKMGLLHCGILNVLPGVELAGVCEPVQLTRRILKKVLRRVPVVADVSELSRLDLDALFITTPTRTHYAVARSVLEGDIARHLFVEKPLSSSYDESSDLCNLIGSKGIGMVGYVRRFMVTFMKAKEFLEQEAIGQPLSFSVNVCSSDFFDVHEPDVSIARGGVLKDLGCYPIDLILWYFGEFNIDSASTESLTGPGAVDTVRFKVRGNGSVPPGEVFVSWCVGGYRMPEVEFSIIGSKGSLVVNDDYVRLDVGGDASTLYRLNLSDNVAFWLGGPEYYREDECFVKAIEQKLAEQPSFNSAARVELAIEEVEKRTIKHE